MKKIQQVTLALITALSLFIYSCSPNGDKNSMDPENSSGEGATDTTKIPNFDSSHTSDSSHASLLGPLFIIPSINTGEIQLWGFIKPDEYYLKDQEVADKYI